MHILAEVITNLNRNKVLTITSIFTVIILLVLVGVFGMFLLTLSYNSEYMDSMLEIRVFIEPDADQYREGIVGEALRDDGRVAGITFTSKEQAFEEALELYDTDTIEKLGPGFLPSSYTVKIKDSTDAEAFAAFAEGLPDVYRVDFHQGSFDFAVSITHWINLVAGILAVLLGILALFLISNTIRLTLSNRSDEVMIMKFIGATEGRIKTPFILEGISIGFFGAAISSIAVSMVYNRLYEWFNADGSGEMFLEGIRLIPVKESILMFFIVFFGLGTLLGMFGSMMAIRKHLKV